MRLDYSHTREWNNTDGSKNKKIVITAEASDVQYICVAADIPGSRDQEHVASIFLQAVPDGSTTHDATSVISTEKSGSNQNRMIGRWQPLVQPPYLVKQLVFHIP